MFGHADQDLEFVEARHADDALALRHDLADLGLDGGDDAGGVGAQFGVGEIVFGRGELAAGLVDAGECRGRQRLALVEGLLCEGRAAAQRQVAVMVGLGAGVVGVGRRQRRAGIVDGKPVVGGIEAGDHVARPSPWRRHRSHDARSCRRRGNQACSRFAERRCRPARGTERGACRRFRRPARGGRLVRWWRPRGRRSPSGTGRQSLRLRPQRRRRRSRRA